MTKIKQGDLLFSRANTLELVGSIAIVEHLADDNLYLSDKILRLNCLPEIRSWIAWYLRSPEGRRQLQDASSGNQESMRNISQSKLLAILIPMPSQQVRDSTIASISEKLRTVRSATVTAERALKNLAEIEEGLVSAAFRGELEGGTGGALPQSPRTDSEIELHSSQPQETVRRPDVASQPLGLRDIVARYGDASDARSIWLSSGLSIDVFYKTLRRDIAAGELKIDSQGRVSVA
jgi:hypothetical protein